MQIQLPEMKEDEKYGGITLKDGEPFEHIILLDGEFIGDWQSANAWAAERGGELPDCQIGALLYANLKDEFKKAWYWLAPQYSPDFAWTQYFGGGTQLSNHKVIEYRARAVRRLPI